MRRRPPRLCRACLALLAGVGLVAPAAAQECAPWPGEPARLLADSSEDAWIARWRELRIAELCQRARSLEEAAPVESHLLWRRVGCLDPWNQEARAGAERTRPLRVHRPPLVALAAPPAPADPWQGLAAPLPLAAPAPVAKPDPAASGAARERRLALIGGLLVAAESLLRAERYDEAAETASHARRSLASLPEGADLHAPRLRLEVLSARAALAQGREATARAYLAAALALDPDFEPDPAQASPALRRALRAAAESAP